MIDKIYIGLGSNKGDKMQFLQDSVNEIGTSEKSRVLKCSAIYESTPLGEIVQDNFFNMVIEIETVLGVFELFYFLKTIETKLGRPEIYEKWGPREIDIDLLFYNNLTYENNQLIVPHKEALSRDFVVVPLLEIAPDFVHPISHKKLADVDLSYLEKHIINKIEHSFI